MMMVCVTYTLIWWNRWNMLSLSSSRFDVVVGVVVYFWIDYWFYDRIGRWKIFIITSHCIIILGDKLGRKLCWFVIVVPVTRPWHRTWYMEMYVSCWDLFLIMSVLHNHLSLVNSINGIRRNVPYLPQATSSYSKLVSTNCSTLIIEDPYHPSPHHFVAAESDMCVSPRSAQNGQQKPPSRKWHVLHKIVCCVIIAQGAVSNSTLIEYRISFVHFNPVFYITHCYCRWCFFVCVLIASKILIAFHP